MLFTLRKKAAKHLFGRFFFGLSLFFGVHTYAYLREPLTEGNPELGKQKSAPCAACHQIDGNSVNPAFPNIAGQSERYLFRQLKAFQAGKSKGRFNPVMMAQTAKLTEQDSHDIAAYFAIQLIQPGVTKPAYLALGERLYRGGDFERHIPACIACHGPRGLGNQEAGFPVLSGQHAEYTEQQLLAYQKGERQTDLNGIMQQISKRLTGQDIKALAQYVAGLH